MMAEVAEVSVAKSRHLKDDLVDMPQSSRALEPQVFAQNDALFELAKSVLCGLRWDWHDLAIERRSQTGQED